MQMPHLSADRVADTPLEAVKYNFFVFHQYWLKTTVKILLCILISILPVFLGFRYDTHVNVVESFICSVDSDIISFKNKESNSNHAPMDYIQWSKDEGSEVCFSLELWLKIKDQKHAELFRLFVTKLNHVTKMLDGEWEMHWRWNVLWRKKLLTTFMQIYIIYIYWRSNNDLRHNVTIRFLLNYIHILQLIIIPPFPLITRNRNYLDICMRGLMTILYNNKTFTSQNLISVKTRF